MKSVPATPDLLEELEALYRETDAFMAGWSCEGSTVCCRFGLTGREPYVTSIELGLLVRAMAVRGGPLPQRRRALPMTSAARDAVAMRRSTTGGERTCPLLDEHGKCAVYGSRPFGCRTYFCNRATGPGRMPRDQVRRMTARIGELAARHCPDGDRVRPLGRFLGVR